MNTEHKEFSFKYRVEGKTALFGWGKWGTAFSVIAILSVVIPFLFFLYRTLSGEKQFLAFTIIFGILALLFVPYQLWIKKYYFFGLTKDSTLIMQSVLNFIPKSYEIKVHSISHLKQDNISKSPAVLFYDTNNELIARFNPMIMKYSTFLGYIGEIRKVNPNIKLDFKGMDKINNDSKY